MERMKELQESLLRDEGASQEEMENRFELEKSESLLVTPSGTGSQVSVLGAASPFILLMGADTSTHLCLLLRRGSDWPLNPGLLALNSGLV